MICMCAVVLQPLASGRFLRIWTNSRHPCLFPIVSDSILGGLFGCCLCSRVCGRGTRWTIDSATLRLLFSGTLVTFHSSVISTSLAVCRRSLHNWTSTASIFMDNW